MLDGDCLIFLGLAKNDQVVCKKEVEIGRSSRTNSNPKESPYPWAMASIKRVERPSVTNRKRKGKRGSPYCIALVGYKKPLGSPLIMKEKIVVSTERITVLIYPWMKPKRSITPL